MAHQFSWSTNYCSKFSCSFQFVSRTFVKTPRKRHIWKILIELFFLNRRKKRSIWCRPSCIPVSIVIILIVLVVLVPLLDQPNLVATSTPSVPISLHCSDECRWVSEWNILSLRSIKWSCFSCLVKDLGQFMFMTTSMVWEIFGNQNHLSYR